MLLQEIVTIIRRWLWLLVLGALVGALLSYGTALRSTAMYETTAGVVVVQQGVKINLDPRFVATTGEGGLFNVQGDGLSTLALLVTNDAIAEQVYADLNGDLSQLVQQSTQLTGMVSGDIQKGMIQIKARSSNPQLSQKLANAWAVHYADYVNRIYAGKLVATGLTEQIRNAKTRYEEAEAALTESLSILITSRRHGDGRSTVAANLAVVTALSGRSVLLIDANLRSPHLHEFFGISNTTGLTDLLQNPAWDVGSIVQETGTPGLQLLPAGARNALAVDLLASERMGAILTEASGHADFIIIDSAALTPITDSLSLARAADVTYLVARVGTTRIMEVQQLRQLVEGVGGSIHGVVLNRVPPPGGFLNPIVRALRAREA